MTYIATEREQYWQKMWQEQKLYTTDLTDNSKPAYYNLTMFPYPSGDKLHVGHWYNYAPLDSWGRFMRMRGHSVFQPMGFDSFGLPAENYAIKTGVHPKESTTVNIEKMRQQLTAMGGMWDWEHEVVTSDPEYYKWTQWLFIKLYEAGLVERRKAPVNWCPGCQTVLANEQVEDGACERCKSEVIKKNLTQWFIKITDYADRLLDYSDLDWPEKTMLMQKHWIGRSEGAEIEFAVFGDEERKLRVYTTRPDTLFGATCMVMAPEHELVSQITTETYIKEVQKYVDHASKMTEIDRTNEEREKTGVFTGTYAINPATKEKIPVYVADFALVHYGTGIVMCTPAHDLRDHAFATKYDLPIKQVVKPKDGTEIDVQKEAFKEHGIAVNSDFLNGVPTAEAITKMISWLTEQDFGEGKVNFKLRDWLISRQRYWGAPIPIIYCDDCGAQPVPEAQLPIILPDDVDFNPKGTAPLATSESFVNTECPKCGGKAKREVDTMDTFMCSSWYYLRYLSPKNDQVAVDNEMAKKWLPVDMYIGGPEHACMHLLYARFINMVMYDLGYTPHKEPFTRLVHQGLITKDGAKMSKSKGNTVSPDEFVEKYGSDVFRMYLMFLGPFTEGGDWGDQGITGIARFQQRFYTIMMDLEMVETDKEVDRLLHKTIKKVTDDLWNMQFNTALAALMEFTNAILKHGKITESAREKVTLLIAPMAPHFAEELWHLSGHEGSIFNITEWPEFDPALAKDDQLTIVVQVNGKLRGEFTADLTADKEAIVLAAKTLDNVKLYLDQKEIVKEIYVPGRLVNLVVK